jgi:hypothetical protein
MPTGKPGRLTVTPFKQHLLLGSRRFGFPKMARPSIELGPFTPERCTVCGILIPQVQDSNPGARLWTRHLNYVDHLKIHHPEYYRWSRLWTYSFYLPVISIVMISYFSAIERSLFLALLAVIVAGALYCPLLFIRRRSVRVFREAWNLSETEV